MDLFVVNRYIGENVSSVKDEELKLDKVLKKINKRKLAREKRKLNLKENVEVNQELPVTPSNEDIPKESELNKDQENKGNVEETDDDEPKVKKSKIIPTDLEGFTILGVDKFDKKKSVKRILPKWLRNPTVISLDLNKLNTKISQTNLNSTLKHKLKEKSIKYLFPVQAEFIPWQLNAAKVSDLIVPPDACVSAPTGSGKTLAFTIPILHHLMQQLENRCITIKAVRALIVLPTQSLALQIFNTLKPLSTDTGIDVGLATGAGTKALEIEQKQLISYNSVWGASSKVDILICTAGRLVDHLKSTKGFDLTHLQYVIIDEADRVLDSVQDDWLYHLGIHLRNDNGNFLSRNVLNLKSIKERTDPQKLLFSATLSQDPEKLQKLSLFQPKLFTCITNENDETSTHAAERFIGKYTTPSELTEKYVICTIDTKPLVLYKLIMDEMSKSVTSRILVFVNTLETLHRLNLLLSFMSQGAFSHSEISSNRGNLDARKLLLKKFEDGQLHVLVCTDSMARGIDIPNVDCVISYSVPSHLKTYIHRAGRTARAGSLGLSISMLHTKQQSTFLNMMENMSNSKTVEKIDILNEDLESLMPLYKQSLLQLKARVTDEMQQSALNMKNKKKFSNTRKKRKMKKRNIEK